MKNESRSTVEDSIAALYAKQKASNVREAISAAREHMRLQFWKDHVRFRDGDKVSVVSLEKLVDECCIKDKVLVQLRDGTYVKSPKDVREAVRIMNTALAKPEYEVPSFSSIFEEKYGSRRYAASGCAAACMDID